MSKYLEDKEAKEFDIPSTLIKAQYNPYTGLIVSTDDLSGKYIGYYTEDNMPAFGGYYDGYPEGTDEDSSDGDTDATGEDGNTDETTDASVPDASGEAPVEDPSNSGEELPDEGTDVEPPEGGGEQGGDEPVEGGDVTVPAV